MQGSTQAGNQPLGEGDRGDYRDAWRAVYRVASEELSWDGYERAKAYGASTLVAAERGVKLGLLFKAAHIAPGDVAP